MPAGVPAATTTFDPLRVTPGLVELMNESVTLAGIIGDPFSRSFDSTLVKEVPPTKPFTMLPSSSFATIVAAVTGTVTTAGSQFVGFRFSQIW